ncbi:hypothetical protein NQ314_006225 [Rhamnusium bicolor]|uniref:Uncharacterized protein n=1 Tax=Rhamnusium bicolor TaxID=1586634 RepID=A0AAV8Z820_9CUCU|nr:hypothetical protein NQ314_006225 [Rhamnusium bicolor]
MVDHEMIDLGSCGLHVIHGALPTGHKSAGWNINSFLTGLYWLFKDSPARRSDFMSMTKTNIFPYKFCQTRWVESSRAANRALLIFSDVKKYVNDSKVKLPSTVLLATTLEPFLKKFQSDEPLGPFLYTEVQILLINLLEKFVKKDVIPKDAKKILNINFKDSEILLPLNKIDIGFASRKLLKNITESKKHIFYKECRTFLIACVTKIVSRSNLKYDIVKAISCLDPSLICNYPKKAEQRVRLTLEILYEKGVINSDLADKCKMQFNRCVIDYSNNFKMFEPCQRLDKFYTKLLSKHEEYQDFYKIIKIILIFSHGNAIVESGFSINKELLVENLHENSLIAQRIVYDNLLHKGGAENIDIDNKIINYCRIASRNYKDALEQKKERSKNYFRSKCL